MEYVRNHDAEGVMRHNTVGGEFRGDFTRHTFDPHKHFMRVLIQQGKLLLDSDFYEQVAILLHYIQTLATDLIGPHGGPADWCGFEIISPEGGPPGNLSEDEERRLRERLDKLNLGDFLIGKGHYYVDGRLCENEYYVPYTGQPDLPGVKELERDHRYLVYLDAWERHITSNQDDSIREVALGGPDTATRSVLTWQVKVSELQQELQQQETQDCDELLRNKLATLGQPGQGKLSAQTRSDESPDDHCTVPPESRYHGLENQLYRVEIHRSGAATQQEAAGDFREGRQGNSADGQGATFKWSRDNGSLVFSIFRLSGRMVEVKHLGRDSSRNLARDQWVEIVDDRLAKQGLSGPLFQVEEVDPVDLTVTLRVPQGADPPPSYEENSGIHPLLRIWDSPGAVPVTVSSSDDYGGIPLEDGIEVRFHGDDFQAGDYWIIPARVETGNIEWPKEGTPPDQKAKALLPHGVTHHYAPLAIIQVGNEGVEVLRDCRYKFRSLRECCGPQPQQPPPANTYTYRHERRAEEAERRAEEAARSSSEGESQGGDDLPLAEYDSLNIRQISERLDELSVEEIRRLRDYEVRNKERSTLVNRLNSRIEEAYS